MIRNKGLLKLHKSVFLGAMALFLLALSACGTFQVEVEPEFEVTESTTPPSGPTETPSEPTYQTAVHATFGDQIELVGYSLIPAESESATYAILIWKALDEIQRDYTVFVHVTGADNQLVTQYDRPVGGDSLPTSTWERNDVYSDIHPVEIPEDLPAGQYTLRIGLYSWPSLERLQITNAGADNPDSFTLSSIQVISQE